MVVDACLGGVRRTVPAGMTLDLNFMSAPLDPRIAFTRASTATYTDAGGTIRSAASNAPRWDYDPVSHALRGLLIEEARTNVWPQSADATLWAKGNITAAVPTTIAAQSIAPDGTLSAASVGFPAVSGAGNASILYFASALTAVSSFSIWLRGSVGGEQVYVGGNSGAVFASLPRITLTTQWQRYTFICSAQASGWVFTLGADLRDGTQTSTPAQTIYAWGAQAEQGAFSPSYIATIAASVTRAQDVCAISSANMTPWYASPGGSWMAEFICFVPTPANARVIGEPTSGGGGRSVLFVNGANFPAIQYDQVAGLGTANTTVANAIVKAASTWAVGQAKICLNGGAVASLATLTNGYNYAASGVKFLTVDTITGSADSMTGTIRRVRYWPRVLTDAEMQAVTS